MTPEEFVNYFRKKHINNSTKITFLSSIIFTKFTLVFLGKM